MLTARLANHHPTRFAGFAFLAAGYLQPLVDFDYEGVLESMKDAFGYDLFGYWECVSDQVAWFPLHLS